jgi:hypothetical protein
VIEELCGGKATVAGKIGRELGDEACEPPPPSPFQ